MELTQDQKDRYLSDPGACPFCGSTQICGQHGIMAGGRELRQQIDCQDCEEGWIDVYALTSVEDADA